MFGDVPIGSGVTIDWAGTDLDGVFNNRPVRYRYRIFSPASIDFPGGIAAAWANPSAFRDYYAPFTDWDSASGDTTSVDYTNLIPSQSYLFCVVAFDEVGAYSARFAPAINLIRMLAGQTPTRPRTWGGLMRRFR
jgi:hypothetical protein